MTNPYWGEAMRLVFMPRVPRLFVIIAEGVLLVLLRTKKKNIYIYTNRDTCTQKICKTTREVKHSVLCYLVWQIEKVKWLAIFPLPSALPFNTLDFFLLRIQKDWLSHIEISDWKLFHFSLETFPFYITIRSRHLNKKASLHFIWAVRETCYSKHTFQIILLCF